MTSHKYNNRRWSAYLHQDEIHTIPEREKLYQRHPTPSHFEKDGVYNIVLFTCSVLNPVNAIDVTGTNAEGEPEYTTEDLINLLMTHNTEQGVLMTSGQATAVYNVLKPEVIEEGMV